MSFVSELKGVHSSPFVNGAIYALLVGLMLSVVPTPADAIYFNYARTLREQYFAGTITPAQYWGRSVAVYYGCSAAWYIILALIVIYAAHGSANKIKVLVGLIGAGAVAMVIFNNIHKDDLEQAAVQELSIPKN